MRVWNDGFYDAWTCLHVAHLDVGHRVKEAIARWMIESPFASPLRITCERLAWSAHAVQHHPWHPSNISGLHVLRMDLHALILLVVNRKTLRKVTQHF